MNLPADIPGDAEFFRAFARLEYALKEASYFQRKDGPAAPDWKRFARERSADLENFWKTALRNPQIKFLIDNPPKNRIVKDKRLDWSAPTRIENSRELLCAVQTVRNNLFHGDKSNPNSSGRDECLICASMEVLKLLLAQCVDLGGKFNDYGR